VVIGALIAIFDWSPQQANDATVAVGPVATAVTYLKTHGGLKGVWQQLLA
jgi:hypothetical protein